MSTTKEPAQKLTPHEAVGPVIAGLAAALGIHSLDAATLITALSGKVSGTDAGTVNSTSHIEAPSDPPKKSDMIETALISDHSLSIYRMDSSAEYPLKTSINGRI